MKSIDFRKGTRVWIKKAYRINGKALGIVKKTSWTYASETALVEHGNGERHWYSDNHFSVCKNQTKKKK